MAVTGGDNPPVVAPEEFAPGTVVLVDGYDITTSGQDDHCGGADTEFLIGRRGRVENAWARWVGGPRLRGHVHVVALSCAHCQARTESRCCGIAMCPPHADHHRAVEHAEPDRGRYRAALAAPHDLEYGLTPNLPRVPGLRYQGRGLPLAGRPHTGDGLRVVEYLRHRLVLPGASQDVLGDALRAVAAGDARLPTPARTRHLVADVLARCTWPGLCDASGDEATATWLRLRPALECTDPDSELSRRLPAIAGAVFPGPDEVPTTAAGELAAKDALCGLDPTAPHAVGAGVLGLTSGFGAAVFSRALAAPDGAERVGDAVARIRRDARRVVVDCLIRG